MLILALVLFVLAIILFWQARRQRASVGIPGGRIIYTDTRAWGQKVEEALYSPELGLTGKPDYLVEQKGTIIPVEVKSSRSPESPYDSHIYQLASYCLLVDHTTGKRPPYGILHYTGGASGKSRTFAIDFTPQLEHAILAVLDEMRTVGRKPPGRSHEQPVRCAHCGYRSACDQKIR